VQSEIAIHVEVNNREEKRRKRVVNIRLAKERSTKSVFVAGN